jgi:hypothetical protein
MVAKERVMIARSIPNFDLRSLGGLTCRLLGEVNEIERMSGQVWGALEGQR